MCDYLICLTAGKILQNACIRKQNMIKISKINQIINAVNLAIVIHTNTILLLIQKHVLLSFYTLETPSGFIDILTKDSAIK
jgi:hypothetical protein